MVFSLRQLQKKCREQRQLLYVAFIDLTKAFDLASRKGLFTLLQKIGSSSDPFPIKSGVKQGCVLAPTLFGVFFSLLLSYAFSQSEDGVYLHTRSDGSLFNLACLHAKTKVRQDFTYLGSTISSSHSLDTILNKQIGKAATAMARLAKRVWDNPMVTINTKVQVYQACVLTLCSTAVKHGPSTLAKNADNTFHLRNLRGIVGIAWQDHLEKDREAMYPEERGEEKTALGRGNRCRRQRAESVPSEPGTTFTSDNCNRAC
ncbi:uncharacterized protein LOC143275812 [Babylonia areolata]|uniref:uncharacterized protein LOC143275812 n=1 Tax=Babylonia areolata TaxID=304850 RepID=UPI003FD46145